MYNQYLAPFVPASAAPPDPAAPLADAAAAKKPAGAGGLLQGLTGRLRAIQIDGDTLLALAVVWFVLSDGEVLDTDLLLLAGVLLLLGF